MSKEEEKVLVIRVSGALETKLLMQKITKTPWDLGDALILEMPASTLFSFHLEGKHTGTRLSEARVLRADGLVRLRNDPVE